MTIKFTSDVDIDFGDRNKALALLKTVPASIARDGKLIKHNTGIYPTDIPLDPFLNIASIDHKQAEDIGYVKLDFLNVSVYNQVRDPQHLDELMALSPPWHRLTEEPFASQLLHIGSHLDTIARMPEPVNSIPRLAMLLAIIRPAKRHLIGKTWKEVAADVWTKPADDLYYFKKSHAIAYAHLIVVQMNLLNSVNSANQGN